MSICGLPTHPLTSAPVGGVAVVPGRIGGFHRTAAGYCHSNSRAGRGPPECLGPALTQGPSGICSSLCAGVHVAGLAGLIQFSHRYVTRFHGKEKAPLRP